MEEYSRRKFILNELGNDLLKYQDEVLRILNIEKVKPSDILFKEEVEYEDNVVKIIPVDNSRYDSKIIEKYGEVAKNYRINSSDRTELIYVKTLDI